MEIVAFGESEFILGFELAGLRSVRSEHEAETQVQAILADPKVGIIVTSQRTFDKLSPDLRERMLRAIRPITVILGEQDENEELRAMILKSIGVDLWKSDDE